VKIALITYSFNKIGGIEQVARDIYKALSEFDIRVFESDKNMFYKKFLFSKVLDFSLKNFDVIIVMHPFLLNLLPKKYYQKTICWTHGIDVWGINGKRVKDNLQKVAKIVAVSNFTKEKLKELGVSGVEVIHNAINLDEFVYKPLKKEFPLRLLSVGRLSKEEQYKGQDLVIKALAKLRGFDIVYDVVGSGDDLDRLKKLSDNLGVSERVNFLGKLSFDEIKKAYHNSHLFIMPSFYSIRPDGRATGEGFGIVYLEAGASGRGSIGCDKGGQVDYIRDGINGFLVKPDEENIAKVIKKVYGNWELLENIGKRARGIVEEEFNFDMFKNRVINLIKAF